MRKSLFSGALALFILAMMPVAAIAQPTIDGDVTDGDYVALGTYTEGDGFGPNGLVSLAAFSDANNLYIAVEGSIEDGSGNCFVVFINGSDSNGAAAGAGLPTGSDGFSPFNNIGGTILDLEADMGVRINEDGGNANIYVSAIDYRSGGSTDTFWATGTDNGTALSASGGPWNGASAAYVAAANRTAADTANTGFEVSIPLAAFGASAGDSFEFLAAYTSGDGGFWSSDTIPTIVGQGSTNLGADPDFSGIAGTQATSPTVVPVELSAFQLD